MTRHKEKNKKIGKFEDDGRVIAPMNVDGMPWNMGSGLFGNLPGRRDRSAEDGKAEQNTDKVELTKGETRAIIVHALLAGLLVAGIFSILLIAAVAALIFLWT